MNYFTVGNSYKETFNFVNTSDMLDYIHKIKGLHYMAKRLYCLLYFKMKSEFNTDKRKTGSVKSILGFKRASKGSSVYIEMSRGIISSEMGINQNTVKKYLSQLVAHGLIDDIRTGINKVNKIFLKYPDSAKRYEAKTEYKDFSENIEVQKNSAESANSTLPQENSLFKKTKEIISRLTDESLQPKFVKGIVQLCDSDLSVLDEAVTYTILQRPDNPLAYLHKTLRGRYYEQKTKNISNNNSDLTKKKSKKQSKQNPFNMMDTRNNDHDKLEALAALHLDHSIGLISDEEYDKQKEEIGKWYTE